MFVRPLSSCPEEFQHYDNTDSIVVHRQYYNDILSKILTQPYLLLSISDLHQTNNVIVTLGGVHHDEPNDIYMPTWLYRHLNQDNDGCMCRIECNSYDLLSLEPVNHCRIRVNMVATDEIDIRSNIELALANFHTLKKGQIIPLPIIEFEGYIDEMEILDLENKDNRSIQQGFIQAMSDVTLDLVTLPEPEPAPVPVPIPVAPIPEPEPEQVQQPSAEERARLIRESWLRRLVTDPTLSNQM